MDEELLTVSLPAIKMFKISSLRIVLSGVEVSLWLLIQNLSKGTQTGSLLDQMIKEGFALRNLVRLFLGNGPRPMISLDCILHDGIPAASQLRQRNGLLSS